MITIENTLPPGTKIDEFIIDKTLGGGGFSIVYLARNESGKQVVVKEYMPHRLATRDEGLRVVPQNEAVAENLSRGRRLFFQEAGTLTGLKHPNIVNVTHFFRANGTVYMVMDYEVGVNLQTYIKRHKGRLNEQFIIVVFIPLLRGLQAIHAHGLLHLDIKPANVYLRKDGGPLLLDLGAADEVLQNRLFQASQVVTPGFSPIEQLDPSGDIGPWTDIYAIGATMRTCIDGVAPPPASERRKKDKLKPAVKAHKRRYSAPLLAAIDWAMKVAPMDRPHTVGEFLQAMPPLEPTAPPEDD